MGLRKDDAVMVKFGYKEPVYTIGIVAKKLSICAATLRIWERKGLVKPARAGKDRLYSSCDIDRLIYIKNLLQEKHINIEGAKAILSTTRCWEVKQCKPKERSACSVYKKYGSS